MEEEEEAKKTFSRYVRLEHHLQTTVDSYERLGGPYFCVLGTVAGVWYSQAYFFSLVNQFDSLHL